MNNRIITISREFGSGGRTIGKSAARKLGIPCYDQELIEQLAGESGFTAGYIQEHGEYAEHSNWFSNAFTGRSMDGASTQDYLWIIQQKVILELAEKGPCVIVGRCADYILREHADCLTAFIHADMDKRAERIVKIYGEAEDTPQKRLRDKDKRRAAYYRFYTGLRWGQARNYHVALDGGALGTDRCAAILVELF